MAVGVIWKDPADVSRIIDACLEMSDRLAVSKPLLSRRYRVIADDLGDALDRSPVRATSLPPFVPGQQLAV